MIFVLTDDSMLAVLDSEKEAQRACEAVDVEDNVYKFFDENGRPLVAEFIKPNRRGTFLGLLRWVTSGTYRLVPAEPSRLPRLLDLWDSIHGLEKNAHFSTLQECSGFHAEPCFQYGVCQAGTIGHTERFRSMRTVRKRTALESPSTRCHVLGFDRVKCP